MLCGDLEGADISWGDLSLDVEALVPLERCDSQINMVSHAEVHFSVVRVGVTFLS